MCLITTKSRMVAENDITCYKIMEYSEREKKWYTPIKGVHVSDVVITGSRLMEARGFGFVKRLACFDIDGERYIKMVVGKGYIHSFSGVPSAFKPSYYGIGGNEYSTHLFECVIPAGTVYWESEDMCEYAAKEIRFVKKIK